MRATLELEAELAKFNMTMEDLREQGRLTMQQQRLVFEEVNRSIVVTETDIQEYYDENAEEFRNAEEVRLEQLVFIGDAGRPGRVRQSEAVEELRGGGGRSRNRRRQVRRCHCSATTPGPISGFPI